MYYSFFVTNYVSKSEELGLKLQHYNAGKEHKKYAHNVFEETSLKLKLRNPKKMWEENNEENWW
jgi:hypothetical protein